MKLRCTTNSIRLRLRKSELEKLEQNGQIQDGIQLPDGNAFNFSVRQELAISTIQVNMREGHLEVVVPVEEAQTWIKTEQVGMETTVPLETGENLSVLIEKDFPCAHQPMEDKSDTFQDLAKKHGK